MSAERWYLQQGIKSKHEKIEALSKKPKRRLKADIVKSLNDLMQTNIKSFDKMTVTDLLTLEDRLKEKEE